MRLRESLKLSAFTLGISLFTGAALQAATLPITPDQRATAERVAQAGVPLSELATNAPESHTVKPGDTLWDISGLFLKSAWRWPELWGMNRTQIANPHLIYPGQVLVLVKVDGRARLQLAGGKGDTSGMPTIKLTPQIRSSPFDSNAIAAIPLALIEPFLNEAVVFDEDALARAPRIVATTEGHVLLTGGELAYARSNTEGELTQAPDYRIFRNTRPLLDPTTREILGYEAPYLGTAELVRPGATNTRSDGKVEIVPATIQIKAVRQEVGIGDRLWPVPQRSFDRYVPHAPAAPIDGQIVSIYGDALNAGQNQIVALNRGSRDGMERGHVLALWLAGRTTLDRTAAKPELIRLPDERHGVLFVFQVYSRVSYALIMSVKEPVRAGDRFTQP